MSTDGQSLIKQATPWKSGAAWWLAFVEGVVALILGLYVILATTEAATLLGLIGAIFLVVNGAIQLYAGMKIRREGRFGQVAFWRGFIGVIVGASILIMYFLGVQFRELAILLLWLGMIAYGLLGIYLAIAGPGRQGGLNWRVLLGSIIILLLGLAIAYSDLFKADIVSIIGALFVILGVILILFAVARRMAEQATSSEDKT